MKKVELVLIPSPGLSHLISTVEKAKLLLDRDDRLSVTVLIMKLSKDRVIDSYTQNITSNPNTTKRLRFVNLPQQDETSDSTANLFDFINNQIVHIREIVSNLIKNPSEFDSQLAGLVLDMFCTKFIEVADEFNLPSYVFFTSGACSLGLFQFLVSLKFEHNQELTQYKNSDAEFSVPCFSIPVPAKVLPAVFVREGPVATIFMNYFRRIKEVKGVMVNTFYELEPFAIQSLAGMKPFPTEYEDFQEVLSEGFLERTVGIGKVIGWAPQAAVLSHPSVGGFVSHCGWNSILESVWFGVPLATFPLYAEQQLNAFELVKELGMAEALKIDHHMPDFRGSEPPKIVGAEEIEAAIRRLMAEEEEGGSGVRRKVKEMKDKSRMALMEGGSSYNTQNLFIEDVIRNIS
ncbi:hypothetical protein BUALT_Bualt03G0215900 [Buddleja alternifolia]|uniref:Glycosyltransferase n=1 Tax=Buddleja alternifolia TaxID=168488 RepID=A0AAV6XXD5_9LAMI|nr:hypothetical protein BUALT_Bualt03G0215900 [Buddleja alternifolia]